MDLRLNLSEVREYRSATQRVRVATESWAERNAYCCGCGGQLLRVAANRPVLDFVCQDCGDGFELKATRGRWGHRVVDGAYSAMAQRLAARNGPSFLFLAYEPLLERVVDLFAVPSYFLDLAAIEKRRPLAPTARRAGWVGCSILLDRIPSGGRVSYIVRNVIVPKAEVMHAWRRTRFVAAARTMERRSWMLEVMRCIDALQADEFTLPEVYRFERRLQALFPDNRFVRAKVRQQLQVLRDAGWLRFVGRGRYVRTSIGAETLVDKMS